MRQSEIAADSMDMGVDRNHELGGRHWPQAEVDPIGRANHPSRVEDEALTRASSARIANEVTQAATGRIPAKRVGKTGQAFPKVATAGPVEVGEGVAEGLVLAEQSPSLPQQRCNVLPPIDAVDKPSEAAAELRGLGVLDRGCRVWAQRGEHTIDTSPGSNRVAESKARGDEPHDLLVTRFLVAVDEIDRVPASSRLRVGAGEQGVQMFAETVHFAGVLAILPSQLQ